MQSSFFVFSMRKSFYKLEAQVSPSSSLKKNIGNHHDEAKHAKCYSISNDDDDDDDKRII